MSQDMIEVEGSGGMEGSMVEDEAILLLASLAGNKCKRSSEGCVKTETQGTDDSARKNQAVKRKRNAETAARGAIRKNRNRVEEVVAQVKSSSESGEEENTVIFQYLTPSDLRLTPEALVATKVSHFRCNVNGCRRDYRSHTALARHRKDKHSEWGKHQAHSANEDCSLQADCKDGHCGAEHPCTSDSDCSGAIPHCHEGMEWPPDRNRVFTCPEPSCGHSAGQVQSLRYHYLRSHGDQDRFRCDSCGKTFAMKTDLNRHVSSCSLGFTCECGKLLRTAEGLETHKRIFHRQDGLRSEQHQQDRHEEEDEGPKSATRVHSHAHPHHTHTASSACADKESSKRSRRVAYCSYADKEEDESDGEGEILADHIRFLMPSDFVISEDQLFSTASEGIFTCGWKGCQARLKSIAMLANHRKEHRDWIPYNPRKHVGENATCPCRDSSSPLSHTEDEKHVCRHSHAKEGQEEEEAWLSSRQCRFMCTRVEEGCSASFEDLPQLKLHVTTKHPSSTIQA